MNKIAILFPGVGYHCDKPLLYYGKKLARAAGYQIIEVPYTGFESEIRGNAEKMKTAFLHALAQAEEILTGYTFSPDDDILILSKSVGTVVAGAWQNKQGIHAKNIYFTPVEASFDYITAGSGIVFHGTSDPWAQTSVVKAACEKLTLPLYLTENANHSLEKDNPLEDLENMKLIMEKCQQYINETR